MRSRSTRSRVLKLDRKYSPFFDLTPIRAKLASQPICPLYPLL